MDQPLFLSLNIYDLFFLSEAFSRIAFQNSKFSRSGFSCGIWRNEKYKINLCGCTDFQ
jgi:hypothetical protein